MAQGAATEQKLGELHDQLATLFSKILSGYELKLEVFDRIKDADNIEEEIMVELLKAPLEPSPAMLSAVSKFLKDNDISVDREELDKLSVQEERLKNKKKNRPDLNSITNLRVVGED
jgi:hypothetical protein